jgi:hypothetical protein
MKRFAIGLVVPMLILASAVPVAAQAEEGVPFTGATHGFGMVQPDEACPPINLRSVVSTSGFVSDMGMVQLDWYNCTPEGADVEGIEMTFVAENGDQVFATYEAHNAPAVTEEPMLMEIDYEFEIIGGTGQYEGATGGGQLDATMAWPGFDINYWPGMVLIDGTITY